MHHILFLNKSVGGVTSPAKGLLINYVLSHQPAHPKKNPAHTSARPIGPSVRRRMQGATWLASDVINHTCNRRRLAGPSERK